MGRTARFSTSITYFVTGEAPIRGNMTLRVNRQSPSTRWSWPSRLSLGEDCFLFIRSSEEIKLNSSLPLPMQPGVYALQQQNSITCEQNVAPTRDLVVLLATILVPEYHVFTTRHLLIEPPRLSIQPQHLNRSKPNTVRRSANVMCI